MLTDGELVTVIAGVNRAVVHCVVRQNEPSHEPSTSWRWTARTVYNGRGHEKVVRSLWLVDEGVTWERGHTDGASLLAAKLLVESGA